MPLALPRGLEWWREQRGGADWLERLQRLASECAEEWRLRLGAPFEPATVSLVVPATLPDGSEAVLKLAFPEPESARESDALAAWDGRGAVRLLARDEVRSALLVERCLPGDQLWAESDEARANGSLRVFFAGFGASPSQTIPSGSLRTSRLSGKRESRPRGIASDVPSSARFSIWRSMLSAISAPHSPRS